MVSVVVVEDEASLRNDLVDHLRLRGIQAEGAGSGVELDALLTQGGFDVAVLDINLPGEDGFKLAQRHRQRFRAGIIMLTARGHLVDRVVGLELGADVYLVKPVDFLELEAQIRALARRAEEFRGAAAAAAVPAQGNPNGWHYDAVTWQLSAPGGKTLKLTATERVFLSLLAASPAGAVSRTEIFKALGKREWDPNDRSIDSMVRRLRQRARAELDAEIPVEPVHGVGYAFAAPITTTEPG